MAMIDVLSHGRLDCGFIKGVFWEMSATNARPTDMYPRAYEAIDLIVKAWTSHDGPFNWEGEFFHHREVNIVPRPYQQPHPPIWVTTTSIPPIAAIAERDYAMGTIFCGTETAIKLFNQYRDVYKKRHGVAPHPEKLGYSAFCYVADSNAEALREGPKIQDFLIQTFRSPKGQIDLPGYHNPHVRANFMKAEFEEPGSAFRFDAAGKSTPQTLVDTGIAFYGTPDSVFEQLKTFFYATGGFGNFMGMFQASTMSYKATTKSLRLFAEHVLPRFRAEVYEPWLKEHGFDDVLLPKAGGTAPNLGVAAGIGSPQAA
jgi:alkanesulfonate monooxygenase SsuD/methylene tetrahydromethanopterin reductase-like flavin-dependent oxidoreductase (luciferase family)